MFFLDGGADSVLLHKADLLGWTLISGGLALFVLAVLWATGRV